MKGIPAARKGRGGGGDNGIINHIGQLLSDALSASKVPVPAESRRDFSGGRAVEREGGGFSNGRGSPRARYRGRRGALQI